MLARLHQSPHSAHVPLRGGFDKGKAVCGQGPPCRAPGQHGGVHMDPEHPVDQVEGRKDARTQALGHCVCIAAVITHPPGLRSSHLDMAIA